MAQTQQITSLALGIDDAARSIGVARSALYEIIARGEIGSFKLGRRRLILMTELKTFIERAAMEGAR
ncbi:hypothetical protein D9M71_652620 [compost metagenome]|jgi:excisionase family DNA binding protein|uniref:DNA-binding protein n=1 Tax=Pseudomonas laurylsulfatiphila TaxID=2011015 RepID=A0A2S6FM03_9PSED|nr:helix-turn-helix domain-containing protein [Pseudomonas laurylsulfatiphila]PPK38489.1 DNA-binding protein [Pseudomonas laurylsulfatiphila]